MWVYVPSKVVEKERPPRVITRSLTSKQVATARKSIRSYRHLKMKLHKDPTLKKKGFIVKGKQVKGSELQVVEFPNLLQKQFMQIRYFTK